MALPPGARTESPGLLRLGPPATRPASAAASSTDLTATAMPVNSRLMRKSRETAGLAAPNGVHMVFVHRERGPRPVAVTSELGAGGRPHRPGRRGDRLHGVGRSVSERRSAWETRGWCRPPGRMVVGSTARRPEWGASRSVLPVLVAYSTPPTRLKERASGPRTRIRDPGSGMPPTVLNRSPSVSSDSGVRPMALANPVLPGSRGRLRPRVKGVRGKGPATRNSDQVAPSVASRKRLASTPPAYPVREPFAPTMRWQGSTTHSGFEPSAIPTARAARGRPSTAASSP